LKLRDFLEDIGVNGKVTLKWILDKYGGGVMGRIHLAQERDQWWP